MSYSSIKIIDTSLIIVVINVFYTGIVYYINAVNYMHVYALTALIK